jgi:excisionase family DNA binding protein
MAKDHSASALATVVEAGQLLGVSTSTVWRLLRRGALPSVRSGGRRLIPRRELVGGRREAAAGVAIAEIPPFASDHPILRMVGAARGGGSLPGARDKHAILDK